MHAGVVIDPDGNIILSGSVPRPRSGRLRRQTQGSGQR